MTFSICAVCPETGMIGLAISSSSPAVAARCSYARAGVGVVATQNVTDPTLGSRGLDLMEHGASAAEARDILVRTTDFIEFRQLALVDMQGVTAVFSGENTLGIHATCEKPFVVTAGNLLANTDVPKKMSEAYLKTNNLHMGERLIKTMQAGLAAGGEMGPVHSVGLKVYHKANWPIADLRVDWTDNDPIGELEVLWGHYAPQMDAYITRAINPTDAPSYGVPGDE